MLEELLNYERRTQEVHRKATQLHGEYEEALGEEALENAIRRAAHDRGTPFPGLKGRSARLKKEHKKSSITNRIIEVISLPLIGMGVMFGVIQYHEPECQPNKYRSSVSSPAESSPTVPSSTPAYTLPSPVPPSTPYVPQIDEITDTEVRNCLKRLQSWGVDVYTSERRAEEIGNCESAVAAARLNDSKVPFLLNDILAGAVRTCLKRVQQLGTTLSSANLKENFNNCYEPDTSKYGAQFDDESDDYCVREMIRDRKPVGGIEPFRAYVACVNAPR